MTSDHSLARIDPNPFRRGTTISYRIPAREHVRLTVHDAIGNELAVLVDGRKNPGNHLVTFDGAHLNPGVYLCRMAAGGVVQTHTMVIVR